MKRALILACIAATMIPLVGCATVMVCSPPSSSVTLLGEIEPAPSRITYKNWYLLAGLVPLSSNTTQDVITRYQFKDVRVKTYIGVGDWLINYLTYGLLYTNTVEVEGTTK